MVLRETPRAGANSNSRSGWPGEIPPATIRSRTPPAARSAVFSLRIRRFAGTSPDRPSDSTATAITPHPTDCSNQFAHRLAAHQVTMVARHRVSHWPLPGSALLDRGGDRGQGRLIELQVGGADPAVDLERAAGADDRRGDAGAGQH